MYVHMYVLLHVSGCSVKKIKLLGTGAGMGKEKEKVGESRRFQFHMLSTWEYLVRLKYYFVKIDVCEVALLSLGSLINN
jgi:hypothetical protein